MSINVPEYSTMTSRQKEQLIDALLESRNIIEMIKRDRPLTAEELAYQRAVDDDLRRIAATPTTE